MIEFEEVGCCYHRSKPIFERAAFKLPDKAVTMILGANGCGKTTLLRCMTNQLRPYRGCVRIDGISLSSLSIRSIARKMSYVPQGIESGIDFSVADFLVFGRTPYLGLLDVPSSKDYETAYQYAKKNGIASLMNSNMNEISGGERQLAYITRALIQETPIIVMDEPMSALDMSNQAMILKIISRLAEEGKTIVLTSHNPNHALAIPAQVLMIDREKHIYQGDAETILSDRRILVASFGNSICFHKYPDSSHVSFAI